MALPEQLNHFKKLGMLFEGACLKHCRGTQWQQSHHGTYLQTHGIAVGEVKQIVEESVRLVPHLVLAPADVVHGVGNPSEMLEKASGEFLIYRIVFRQDQRDFQHALAVECHPCRAVRLVQMTARGQRRTAIEDPDVVEPQESTREDIFPLWVFAVDPPVEVLHQPLERPLEETQVSASQL